MAINGIDFWKLKEWITIHEAACLALDCDPSILDAEPPGWKGCYSALMEAVEFDLKEEIINDKKIKRLSSYLREKSQDIIDSLIESNKNLIFTSNSVRGYDLKYRNDFGAGDIELAQIKVSAIKEWLELRGIRPAFFFSEEPEYQTPTSNENPIYETPLMLIMYATIDQFYGENFESGDSDSHTSQKDVLEWLTVNYALSGAKAMAIDKMTRPNRLRDPKGQS